MKRYLSVADAAEYLGLSKWTVYDLVRAEDIPHNRLPSGTIRFDIQDLDLWMRRQRVEARS